MVLSANSIVWALAILAIGCLLLALFWNVLLPNAMQRRIHKFTLDKHSVLPTLSEENASVHDMQVLPETGNGWLSNRHSLSKRLSKIIAPDVSKQLLCAGYHGRWPLTIFMLAKFLTPIFIFPISWFYLDMTLATKLSSGTVIAFSIVLSILSFWAPELFLKNMTVRRKKRIGKAWPDALVLLQLCVEAGLGPEAAIAKVAQEIKEISPDISYEFSATLAELIYFPNRRLALKNLGDRIDLEMVREVALVLAQAEQYGMALGETLHTLAAESRRVRLAAAEKKAAALPALLTVPMILFFLPALFVVILTPALIQVFSMN